MLEKERSKLNQTISLTEQELDLFSKRLKVLNSPAQVEDVSNSTINQDLFESIKYLPEGFVDLLFIDPPYNLSKDFNGNAFKEMSIKSYTEWMESWFSKLIKVLKPNASIYICGDWKSSTSIHYLLEKYFTIRNRITWEREKGRGAKANWKNSSEDIWYATVNDEYTFNIEDVKLKRKVIAPYVDDKGKAKDWDSTDDGNFRLTHPSNIWTDLTVPFWSMSENTDHPTQKPEKLLAKIILASSNAGDVVLDPMCGSGTTSVVAKKLSRVYCGIEKDLDYACLTEKRLEMAEYDKSIQGYENGIFFERNSGLIRTKSKDVEKTVQKDKLF
jgi:site-specific DNA-methyltransferase (adenine-specific)